MNKLTPREPTPEMVDAGQKAAHWTTDYVTRVIWRAMHDAAPSAEPVADEPVAQRVPLTDAEILKLWGPRSDGPDNHEIISFARAVLRRAHGIGAKP